MKHFLKWVSAKVFGFQYVTDNCNNGKMYRVYYVEGDPCVYEENGLLSYLDKRNPRHNEKLSYLAKRDLRSDSMVKLDKQHRVISDRVRPAAFNRKPIQFRKRIYNVGL